MNRQETADTFIAIWEKEVTMMRAALYISGSVQRTGYRTKVVSIAKALDIRGNVQNLPDGRVKIIAEGEEKDLERFIQAVDIKNTLINVTDIKKEYSAPSGEYESFYKLVSEGETDERLDTAADLLKELIHVTKNGFSSLGKKQDIMIEKQDIMIEKQDIMIRKQDETMSKIDELGEKLGNKIDQSRTEITSEIHFLRDDFRTRFDERLSRIEVELAEIKAKVAAIH